VVVPATAQPARAMDVRRAAVGGGGVDRAVGKFIAQEIAEMSNHQLTKTANRSVLGSMNDFAHLAEAHGTPKKAIDLLELSLRLAQTPCGPLYRSHVSPDREITAYVTEHTR
jgi:hypothetical protein